MPQPNQKIQKIPNPTIERLALYTRPLESLAATKVQVVSSEVLAQMCGVKPAQVRKDLAYFGEFGTRGVGYDVEALLNAIKKILSTDRTWRLCVVGMGNLGKALADSENFRKRGYNVLAVFDQDPKKVGERLLSGLEILPLDLLPEKAKELAIDMGIIATISGEAKRVRDLMISSGITIILNFSPLHLRAPEGCLLENVDLAVRFERLAYLLAKGAKEKVPIKTGLTS